MSRQLQLRTTRNTMRQHVTINHEDTALAAIKRAWPRLKKALGVHQFKVEIRVGGADGISIYKEIR